jgi:hypothetical protein
VRLRWAAEVSVLLTLLSTNVERLRHLNSHTISLGHFALHTNLLLAQAPRDSSRLAQIKSSGPALAVPEYREKEEMLKITITDTATVERWTLQGRLVAPWVNELKTSWKRARRAIRRRRCIVNLDEVTFIDKGGERMLRSMSKQGARLVASDVYVKHVLDRLCGKSD